MTHDGVVLLLRKWLPHEHLEVLAVEGGEGECGDVHRDVDKGDGNRILDGNGVRLTVVIADRIP